MKKVLVSASMIAGLLMMATPGWADTVGSIVLTGHDPDFHADFSEPGEINFNQKAIQFIMDPAFNTFKAGGINKFLFVEGAISPPGGHVDGKNGLIDSGFVLGTNFDVASAATLNTALNQLGVTYSGLVIGSDFGGILTQAELDILNARSADIISFLNAGGGLYAMAESNTGAGLTPGGGRFGFLPFTTTSTSISYCGPVNVTPYGTSLGFVSFDTCADHNSFNGTFGLNVVDTLPDGTIISLAGRGKTDPGTGVTPTAPEPASVVLIGTGLIGLLYRRRRA